jgi:ribosomal protein S18 acetylase RimI-like enzyme
MTFADDPARWTIRFATPHDAAPYAQAAEQFFRQTYGHDAGHAAVMDRHCAETYASRAIAVQLEDPAVTALIANVGAAMVGLAQLRVNGDAGEVERFYIDHQWHGQGLAQDMMEGLHRIAASLGLRSLHLGVWSQNTRAIAFYRRQGFIPSGTVDFLLAGSVQADLLLRKDLS